MVHGGESGEMEIWCLALEKGSIAQEKMSPSDCPVALQVCCNTPCMHE